jgi:hypothetical protein
MRVLTTSCHCCHSFSSYHETVYHGLSSKASEDTIPHPHWLYEAPEPNVHTCLTPDSKRLAYWGLLTSSSHQVTKIHTSSTQRNRTWHTSLKSAPRLLFRSLKSKSHHLHTQTMVIVWLSQQKSREMMGKTKGDDAKGSWKGMCDKAF